MMLIQTILVILLSTSSSLVQGSKSDGSNSQSPLPSLSSVTNSSSSMPIIEAKSVKVTRDISKDSADGQGKISLPSPSLPSPPLPSSGQVNSKRFGDLRLSSLLWSSKKSVDPKFGFPANLGPMDQQSSTIQVPSSPGRTVSWNDQSSSSGSSPLSSRLRGILPSLRLKDVLGSKSMNQQSMLTPSESSQVIVSSIDNTGISSSLGSPLTGSSSGLLSGGGVSNSDLGLSAVSSSSHHEPSRGMVANGLLMNQPEGSTSSGASSSSSSSSPSFSSSSIPSSLTSDQVSKLTASFEHGFNQQVQQQLLHLQQQQGQKTSSEVEGGGGGTSSIFRKLVSSGRSRIPRLPTLSLLSRPSPLNPLISSPSSSSSGGMNPIVTKDHNHISLHKLIPFLWPYKLSPPSGSPIPSSPVPSSPVPSPVPSSPIPSPIVSSTTSKLRGLFKPKFLKLSHGDQSAVMDQQVQDQQQIATYLAHPDLTKHTQHLHHHHHQLSDTFPSSALGSLFVTKQQHTNSEVSNNNIQFKPHLHL